MKYTASTDPAKDKSLAQLRHLTKCLRQGLHRFAVETVDPFPIGLWKCKDGRQVLFDKEYHPIWQRWPDGWIEAADPYEWVDVVHDEFFFPRDSIPWHQQYEGMKRLRHIVVAWASGQDALPPNQWKAVW